MFAPRPIQTVGHKNVLPRRTPAHTIMTLIPTYLDLGLITKNVTKLGRSKLEHDKVKL